MAKAKKQLAGNWELVGGGVFHKSWAGVVFRRRGSAGAYYKGCTFPRQPAITLPPPPPPQVIATWQVSVRGNEFYEVIDSDVFMLVQVVFAVRKLDSSGQPVGVWLTTRELPGYTLKDVTVTPVAVSYSDAGFSKTYVLRAGTYEETVTLEPDYLNPNLQFPEPNLDSQEHQVT